MPPLIRGPGMAPRQLSCTAQLRVLRGWSCAQGTLLRKWEWDWTKGVETLQIGTWQDAGVKEGGQ